MGERNGWSAVDPPAHRSETGFRALLYLSAPFFFPQTQEEFCTIDTSFTMSATAIKLDAFTGFRKHCKYAVRRLP